MVTYVKVSQMVTKNIVVMVLTLFLGSGHIWEKWVDECVCDGGQQDGCTSNGSTASKFQRFTQSAQFWKSRMPLLLHDLQGTSRLRMLKLVKVLRTVDLHLKRLLPFCSFVRAVPHKKRRVHQKRGSCAARDYNFGFRPAGSIFSLSSPALSSLWRERQDPQVPRSVSGRVWQGEQKQHESHFHNKVVSSSFVWDQLPQI